MRAGGHALRWHQKLRVVATLLSAGNGWVVAATRNPPAKTDADDAPLTKIKTQMKSNKNDSFVLDWELSTQCFVVNQAAALNNLRLSLGEL